MDSAQPARVSIRLDRTWDDALMQTADVHPAGSHAALLRYVMDPWPDDGGLPPDIAAALAEGLTQYGLVAGRWFDDDGPGEDARLLPAPRRSLLQRAMERVSRSQPANLLVTRSPRLVGRLFDQGWWAQAQAMLILDPVRDDGREEALEALRILQDWKAFAFPPSVRALIAPGVDGDVVLIAAGSEAALSELLETLELCFSTAKFAFASSDQG